MRNGAIAGRTWITRQLRSTKTTSIANRMATVWMACDGIMNRPVPGSSPRLPNSPTSRRRLVPATLICSPSTVFLVVFRTATVSVSILLLRSHPPARSHTFPPADYDCQQNHSDYGCDDTNYRYVVHNPPYLLYRLISSNVFMIVSTPGPSSTTKSAGKMKIAKGKISFTVVRSEERRVGKECKSRW